MSEGYAAGGYVSGDYTATVQIKNLGPCQRCGALLVRIGGPHRHEHIITRDELERLGEIHKCPGVPKEQG